MTLRVPGVTIDITPPTDIMQEAYRILRDAGYAVVEPSRWSGATLVVLMGHTRVEYRFTIRREALWSLRQEHTDQRYYYPSFPELCLTLGRIRSGERSGLWDVGP